MARSSSSRLAVCLLALCLLALGIGVYNAVRFASNRTRMARVTPLSDGALLNRGNQLALIDLSGAIVMDNSDKGGGLFESESNAVTARKALDTAAKDDNIRGVLLRINSPGGTVGMSQELNAAVQRARQKKPVVVSMGDLAASGGYYTACAADRIVANPGTLTGSIGVIISSVDMSGLLNNKLGIKAVTVKSGKFKDILSPYRAPRPDELSLVQALINSSYQDFLAAVIAGRTRLISDPAEKARRIAAIKAVADGRVLDGRAALASGLVDQLGDLDDAYATLDAMAKKRFHLGNRDRLPLRHVDDGFNLRDFLGTTPFKTPQSSAEGAMSLVPISMRYANRPLWVLE